MKCPFCRANDDFVKSSRTADDGDVYRRRRQCKKCGRRWTTHERADTGHPRVTHKDGGVQEFDPGIVMARVMRHCKGLPVPHEGVIAAARALVELLKTEPELTTARIALDTELTLRELHPVAAIRFLLEWKAPKDAADMLGIVWDFADRAGLIVQCGEKRASAR